MKNTQLIIALTTMFIIVSHTNSYADTCTDAGVITGIACTAETTPGTVIADTKCTASAGCTYHNCLNACRCTNSGCPITGGSTTDCSGVTCNPVWGAIDNATHIQAGQNRTPDTSNNCICKNKVGTLDATVYRCISGYYDSTTGISMLGSKPNCALCPTLGNNNVAGQANPGMTDNPNNRGITSCYIPYDTEITDDTGTYIFQHNKFVIGLTNGCNYTE